MPKILIVDSNTAALNADAVAMGHPPLGAGFAEVLGAIRPEATFTVTLPYDGAPAPDPAGFDGVVFTGSAVEWNTDDARAEPLAAVMRAAFAAGRPTLGSCNGLQLAASVLGGSTGASPKGREDGLARDIRLTDAGRTHPMMAGREDGFEVPCVHRDEVQRLPEGAVILASNAHARVQAMAYAQDGVDFWGMQYHPEYTVDYVADIMRLRLDQTEADVHASTTPAPDPKTRVTELRNWLARFP